VRIDILRAYENEIARATEIEVEGETMRMVSLEDLIARTARLCLDLAGGTQVPAKHARDFLRLRGLVDCESVNAVWEEHRKPAHPESFGEAAALLEELILKRPELQIVPVYSHDPKLVCKRCKPANGFTLAPPERMLGLLGYS
jgi:hypothetical protein